MLGTPSDCLEFLYRVLNLIKERFVSAVQSITKPCKSMKKSRLPARFIVAMIKFTCFHLFLAILTLGVSWAGNSYSQETLARTVTLQIENQDLRSALATIERNARVKFSYDLAIIPEGKVNLRARGESLAEVLEKLLTPLRISYSVSGKYIVLSRRQEEEKSTSMLMVEPPLFREVRGKVTDENGQPLPGVSILVKGTQRGMITDVEGKFVVDVNNYETVLVFSFVGYLSQEIAVDNRSLLEVSLQVDEKSLEEVVVVGYGVQKKANLTGAVVTVGDKELGVATDANIASRLQGRVAGVTVARDNSPGGNVTVRVRGFGSINNNDPLYIIDGVPTTDGLSKLNPNDIESMTILKDASASAIYGSRAANGVIIITTKRGTAGKPSLQFSSRVGVQQSTNQLDLLNTKEYGEMYWLEFRNMGLSPGSVGWGNLQYGYGPEPVIPDYIFPAGKMVGEVDESTYSYPDPYNGITRANKEGTNWYDEIFAPALIQEHNISTTGGTERSTYAFSLGYMDQKGILKYTNFKRYTARANGDLQITNWLKIGQSVGLSTINRTGADYNSEGGPIAQAYRAQPIIPVYDIQGNFAGTKSPTTGNASNPLAELYRNKDNYNNETRILANAYIQIEPVKNLTLKSLLGIDHNRNRTKRFSLRNVEMSEAQLVDALTEEYYGSLQYNWSNTINYKIKIGQDHDLNLLGGSEAVRFNSDWFSGSRSTYAFTDVDYMILNSGESGQASSGSFDNWALFSYFGRFNYSFKDRYLLEAVFRKDASSRFSENNRWGTFPAFSAGWLISEEDFMKGLTWVDEIKIRGGWGANGNDNVGNYNIYSTYRANGTASYYNIAGSSNTESQAGYHKYKLGNPNARWESTTTSNIGLDVRFFKNKFAASLDVYTRKTKDMLYPDSRPSTWGRVVLPSINVGEMKNNGWDLMLSYRGGSKNDFRYVVSANLSHYRNKVVALNNNSAEILYGSTIRNEVFTATKKGEPVSSFYGYMVDGIFNTQAEVDAWPKYSPDINGADRYSMPGVLKFRDVNGDGVITADDRTFIGSPHPDLSYGLNFDLQYKNWDMTVFFQGIQGNSIVNYARRVTDFKHFANNRSKARLYESWTQERYANGSKITLPIALSSEHDVIMQNASSFFVEDGSYFRMKDLQIGYTLPASLNSRWKTDNIRLYLQATNLFTLTKYSGLDPEIRQSSDRQIGVDVGIYPTAQMFMFGINLNL